MATRKPLALVNGLVSELPAGDDLSYTGGGWTTYSPSLSSSVGSFTSASATGRYKQMGKTVFFSLTVSITTNGTAAGIIISSVPVAASTYNQAANGRENGSTGVALAAVILNGVTTIYINKYDGTYAGGSGYALTVQGCYEAA